MTSQFRTCVFSLSVPGRFVRFPRWDREGVTISEVVDYKSNPTPLAHFLRAFASTSHSGRGWNVSAQPPHNPEDELLFRNKVTEHVMFQLNMEKGDKDLANEVNKHHQEKVITKLLIPSAELEGENLQVLVCRPSFTSSSPIGRSTRGYWVWRSGKTWRN